MTEITLTHSEVQKLKASGHWANDGQRCECGWKGENVFIHMQHMLLEFRQQSRRIEEAAAFALIEEDVRRLVEETVQEEVAAIIGDREPVETATHSPLSALGAAVARHPELTLQLLFGLLVASLAVVMLLVFGVGYEMGGGL